MATKGKKPNSSEKKATHIFFSDSDEDELPTKKPAPAKTPLKTVPPLRLRRSAIAKAPKATKPANVQTIPAKGKKANLDSDGNELPKKKSALAKAPRATKPANIQTIPAKGKKANVDSSEESADGDELPMKKSALAKAPMATKPAKAQTIPTKGKKAKASDESSKGPKKQWGIRTTTPKWNVGDNCLALWEDGEWYPARIESISKKTCTVQFIEYDSKTTVNLNDLMIEEEDETDENTQPPLKSRHPHLVQQQEEGKKWKVGDTCLARWSEDDEWYQARIDYISKEACMVQFLGYETRARVNVNDLMSEEEALEDPQMDGMPMEEEQLEEEEAIMGMEIDEEQEQNGMEVSQAEESNQSGALVLVEIEDGPEIRIEEVHGYYFDGHWY